MNCLHMLNNHTVFGQFLTTLMTMDNLEDKDKNKIYDLEQEQAELCLRQTSGRHLRSQI